MSKTNFISVKKDINPDVLNDLIIDAIQEVKGKDIKKFDLRQLEEATADYYIICHATSATQISGILGMIARRITEKTGIKPYHTEGTNSWMLIDYFSVVVHIFSEDKRAFYNLDGLWSDAVITEH